MSATRDYYQILEVEKTATSAEIKKAYYRLSRKYHPDRNPGDQAAAEEFKKVNEANAILSDADKRKVYDQKLAYQKDAEGAKEKFQDWKNNIKFFAEHPDLDQMLKEFFEEKMRNILNSSTLPAKLKEKIRLIDEDLVQKFQVIHQPFVASVRIFTMDASIAMVEAYEKDEKHLDAVMTGLEHIEKTLGAPTIDNLNKTKEYANKLKGGSSALAKVGAAILGFVSYFVGCLGLGLVAGSLVGLANPVTLIPSLITLGVGGAFVGLGILGVWGALKLLERKGESFRFFQCASRMELEQQIKVNSQFGAFI